MHVSRKHFPTRVNISAETRALRKRPVNPDEIAPITGRFSEDEQEADRWRQPPNSQDESWQTADEEDVVEAGRVFGQTRPPSSGAAAPAVEMAASNTASPQMASSLDALLAGIKSETTAPGIEAVLPAHHEAKAEASLDDLLALMRSVPHNP